MSVWVNSVEYHNLRADTDAVLLKPSWLRGVLCEPLTQDEYAERRRSPDIIEAAPDKCDAAAALWTLNKSQQEST